MLAIMGAMEQEVVSLRARLSRRVDQMVFGVEIHRGCLDGVDVLLSRSGIGKVNAAAATLALYQSGASSLIFSGLAGGVDPQLNPGDMVVATELIQHDFDVTMGVDPGQIPGEPFSWSTDPAITDRLELAAHRIDPNLKVLRGRIASGDQFIASAEKSAWLFNTMDSVATEMEGAAVAQIASHLGLPFGVIRTISDNANHCADVDFDSFLPVAAERGLRIMLGYIGLTVSG